MKHFLLPALALLLLTQCQKSDPDPASQLPAATQTGANTFGCLVNGQPWLPGGNDGTSNYSVYYDPTYAQGTLSVATYRITNSGAEQQTIGINSDSMRTSGIYKVRSMGHHNAGFINRNTNCRYYPTDPGTYCKGTLTITRLDYNVGIISGTFSFTLAKAGCDTLKVTQGRFDKKL
ncbi:MAG: hypothetical protein EOO63_10315 [Hymenobacter sp.]|nr:MAG: hypothetical protein EOO63_10315 [Hymenobacter sp.]